MLYSCTNHGHLSPRSGDPLRQTAPMKPMQSARPGCLAVLIQYPHVMWAQTSQARMGTKCPEKKLGIEEAGDLEILMGTNEKAPTKACSL